MEVIVLENEADDRKGKVCTCIIRALQGNSTLALSWRYDRTGRGERNLLQERK